MSQSMTSQSHSARDKARAGRRPGARPMTPDGFPAMFAE